MAVRTSDAEIAAFLARGGAVTKVADDVRTMTEREVWRARRSIGTGGFSEHEWEMGFQRDALNRARGK